MPMLLHAVPGAQLQWTDPRSAYCRGYVDVGNTISLSLRLYFFRHPFRNTSDEVSVHTPTTFKHSKP